VGPDVHQVISELYRLPLAEFTRARNARAAALKAADRPADALAIRELRRPPVTLWAVNRLAQTDAERLATFVASVDEIRRTQLRDPRAASEAALRQRAVLDTLVSRAAALLAEQGQRATAATQRRIADTLLGAAVDREHAEALTGGRLTEELPAPGFEVLAGAAGGRHLRLVSKKAEEGQGRAAQERERRAGERQARAAEQAEQRRRETAARQAQAEQEREQRRQEAEEKRRRAAEHQAVITGLQREVDALASQLAAARERLRAARRGAPPGRPDRTNATPKR
jgi:flagellar biosynthesis GTPase FlhF